MATEMVKRVAAAMKHRAAQPVCNLESLEPALVGSLGDAWEYLAEAALAEMRQPTAAMDRAGDAATEDTDTDPGLPRVIWQDMIDAALAD